MTRKIIALSMILILSSSFSLASIASVSEVEPIRQQSRDQINISEEMQVQARNQLREQLLVKQTDPFNNHLSLQEQARSRFNDVDGHWGQEAVARAWAWGLVNGYPDGGFHPNEPVRSVEGVLMIRRLMQKVEGLPPFAPIEDFDMSQVPSWAQEAFMDPLTQHLSQECHCAGLAPMTRLQFVMALAYALGVQETAFPDVGQPFHDLDALTESEVNVLTSLRILGLVAGINDQFAPEQALSRAEGVAMLIRVLDLLALETVTSQ